MSDLSRIGAAIDSGLPAKFEAHRNCLELLILKGEASAVRKMADALISTKGVMRGRLTITSPEAGS